MRERLGTAAIVFFVLVDIVLVTLAFRHVRPVDPPPADQSAELTSPDFSAGGDASDPSGPAIPSASPTDQGLADVSFMSMAADGTVLRAAGGSCTDGLAPIVQVSTDGGETFRRLAVDADLSQVLRVQADAASDLWLVGADADCELGVYRGDATTQDWELSPGTAGAWHLLPDPASTQIHAPDGTVDLPCTPTDLATLPDGPPRVLCDTGAIVGTDDAGGTWVVLGRLEEAAAVHYTSPSTGLALAPQDGCPATVLETVDGGATWDVLGCLPGGEPRAVAGNAETVVAQVDRRVHVSDDGGVTWRALTSTGG